VAVTQSPLASDHAAFRIAASLPGSGRRIGSVDLRRGSVGLEVANLYVEAPWQRRGIAARLMQHAIQAARALRAPLLTLEALPRRGTVSRQVLNSLYRGLGFSNSGISRLGNPIMTLRLAPAGAVSPRITRTLQRAEDTIGGRVSRHNQAERFHSPRLRERYHPYDDSVDRERDRDAQDAARAASPTRRYTPLRRRGMWDGRSRPPWEDATWTALAAGQEIDGTCYYLCKHPPGCGKKVYRKKDRPGQHREDDATIDHKTDFKKWIHENAAPDGDGEITSLAAREASNDLKNLQVLCRSCNARKNGPRNVFD
jgi:GNAT superfamily N-acetyltransferase